MRTVGDAVEWDDAVARWSGDSIDGPYFSTWPAIGLGGDLADRLLEDPAPGSGLPTGHGDIRFVAQVLSPRQDDAGLWNTSLWNTGLWASDVGEWHDMTARVRAAEWAGGSSMPDGTPDVGDATVTLDNQDGEASPWATVGEFASGSSRSWLSRGRWLRFGFLVGTEWRPAFTGTLSDVKDETSAGVDAWVTLRAWDPSAQLATHPGDVDLTSRGSVSASLLAVLEALALPWQSAGIRVPDEDAMVAAVSVGGWQDSAYASSLLERIAAGVHWSVCADASGQIIAVSRGIASETLDYVFSNAPEGDELPVPASGMVPYSGDARLLTRASARTVGGTTQTAVAAGADVEVSDTYGFPRDDLVLDDDADVLALVTRVVALHGDDDLGVGAMTLDADYSEELADAMTVLATRGRETVGFRVRYTHPSAPETVAIEQYVSALRTEWSFAMSAGEKARWSGTLGLAQVVTAAV